MRIANFNVNRRLANLLAWIDATRPDVVCLQEPNATDDALRLSLKPVLAWFDTRRTQLERGRDGLVKPE